MVSHPLECESHGGSVLRGYLDMKVRIFKIHWYEPVLWAKLHTDLLQSQHPEWISGAWDWGWAWAHHLSLGRGNNCCKSLLRCSLAGPFWRLPSPVDTGLQNGEYEHCPETKSGPHPWRREPRSIVCRTHLDVPGMASQVSSWVGRGRSFSDGRLLHRGRELTIAMHQRGEVPFIASGSTIPVVVCLGTCKVSGMGSVLTVNKASNTQSWMGDRKANARLLRGKSSLGGT